MRGTARRRGAGRDGDDYSGAPQGGRDIVSAGTRTAMPRRSDSPGDPVLPLVRRQPGGLAGSLASSDCGAMGRSFNSKAMRILDKYRLMDRMYDERTEHGAREGALLQGN